MSRRREFSIQVGCEIAERATDSVGNVRCENPRCRAICKKYELHHIDQDAMQRDKRRKLTAKDGLLLCLPCHKVESKKQAPVLAKVIRVQARHLGIKAKKRPIPKRPPALVKRKHGGRPSLNPKALYR